MVRVKMSPVFISMTPSERDQYRSNFREPFEGGEIYYSRHEPFEAGEIHSRDQEQYLQPQLKSEPHLPSMLRGGEIYSRNEPFEAGEIHSRDQEQYLQIQSKSEPHLPSMFMGDIQRPVLPPVPGFERATNITSRTIDDGQFEPKIDHQVNIDIKNCQAMIQRTLSKTTPMLLRATAGSAKCCIFKVSTRFGNLKQPSIVSIGPYHHKNPNLKMIEEHKWRYLKSLLSRKETINRGISLSNYLLSIKPLEAIARECYSKTIHLGSDKFLEMMILDGCFILEIFRKVNNPKLFEQDDPFARMGSILLSFYRDFLRLDNQIPFFILERLFEISKIPGEESGTSLSLLALRFFNNIMRRPQDVIDRCCKLKGIMHLLDLVHSSYTLDLTIPPRKEGPPMLQCISKLRRSGIKLNKVEDQEISVLDVKFKNGVIQMPTLTIDDFMESLLFNCLALEQNYDYVTKHFTSYFTLLNCLVESYKDVEYLCDCNIVENDYGTDVELASFINTMGKDLVFDINDCYLSKLLDDVEKYYQNWWNVQWTSFRRKYFNSPWSFISALAALVLLFLTFAQTFYTIYGYYAHP